MPDARALYIVFLEPGPNTSMDEFHDWYNNEHIPVIQTCPGFLTFTRFAQLDGQKPSWAAMHDTSPIL